MMWKKPVTVIFGFPIANEKYLMAKVEDWRSQLHETPFLPPVPFLPHSSLAGQ